MTAYGVRFADGTVETFPRRELAADVLSAYRVVIAGDWHRFALVRRSARGVWQEDE